MSFLVIGIFLGIVGFLLGIASRKSSLDIRSLAQWGMGMSIVGFILSIGITSYYYHVYKETIAWEDWDEDWEDASYEEWNGKSTPDFTFTDLEGNEHKISDYKGKNLIIDFWATWCGPCIQEIPHFIELQKSIPESQLTIIGISDEDTEKLKKFSKEKNINYLIATSDDLPTPFYEIESIPTTFFIDSNGIIRRVLEGYHDLEELKKNLEILDTTIDTDNEEDAVILKRPSEPTVAILPDVPEVVNYIGDWYHSEEGELCYRVYQQDNGNTVIEYPPNEVWWSKLDNIRIEEGILKFDEYHYTEKRDELKSIVTPDGIHPFSGVRIEVTLEIDGENEDLILMNVTSVTKFNSETISESGKLIRRAGEQR